jgi:hypothetical protein
MCDAGYFPFISFELFNLDSANTSTVNLVPSSFTLARMLAEYAIILTLATSILLQKLV